ncbi:MAG TPA: thermonuclease family protein [Aurantimonas coralicida]|uniref:Thermonuclease family protein n=2 Tax=root TaxID=1 RepID=A0A9C9NHQ4_9HYPH|nr:thermonuclease family protein [Aurantimonas coralicida]HEU01927.1 thermonuclease family protein [Aurantimonas coralicida]
MADPWLDNLADLRKRRHRSEVSNWPKKIVPIPSARQRRHERPFLSRVPFWPLLGLTSALVFFTPLALDRWGGIQLPTSVDLRSIFTDAAAAQRYSGPIGTCSGGNRAARGVTCIVDGDTGWQDGEKWRMKNIDTPEISKPECAAEKRKGLAARDRLRRLMSAGYSLSRDGTGYYGRTLVTVTLADGRDAGDVLVQERLSQRWPNTGNPWCR